MTRKVTICFITGLLLCYHYSFSQRKEDAGIIRNDTLPDAARVHDTLPVLKNDTTKKRIFSPRAAALRSAILPGLGQIYNKKYWKLPIVYGALGATGAVFLFNIKEFNDVSYAYRVLINKDSVNWGKVRADLQPFVQKNATGSLRNYRNQKRKDIDYSVLVFALFWALNVVDATVDAHLKGFDVGGDLGMKVKPGYNPLTRTAAISFALDIHKGKLRELPLP